MFFVVLSTIQPIYDDVPDMPDAEKKVLMFNVSNIFLSSAARTIFLFVHLDNKK